jgi:transcriptional regulator with XRE-family HTH domain
MTAEVGFKLRELRRLYGITQEELAEGSGVGAKMLSAIENGTRRARVDHVERVCRALGVGLPAFFAWDVSGEIRPPELKRA